MKYFGHEVYEILAPSLPGYVDGAGVQTIPFVEVTSPVTRKGKNQFMVTV